MGAWWRGVLHVAGMMWDYADDNIYFLTNQTNSMIATRENSLKAIGQLPDELLHILAIVVTELNGEIEKHPQWPKDHIHAAAIVAEESGELVRAALQHKYEAGAPEEMYKEAIQTSAMGMRFLLNTVQYWLIYEKNTGNE